MAVVRKRGLPRKLKVSDLRWLDEYDPERDGVTQTLLGNWMCCPQKALFVVNRWEQPGKWKTTSFGALVHDVLGDMYVDRGVAPSVEKIDSLIEARLEEATQSLAKKQIDELTITSAKTYAVLVAYSQYYATDWTEKNFKALEKPIMYIEVPGTAIPIHIKPDGEFELSDASLWLLESKTKARIDEVSMWTHLAMDWQTQFYVCGYELGQGRAPMGALYNVLRNPAHKIKSGESIIDFPRRLIATIMKDPEHFFKRREVIFTPGDRERFVKSLGDKLRMFGKMCRGEIPTYRNECACGLPFPCGYQEACSSNSIAGMKKRKVLFEELYR